MNILMVHPHEVYSKTEPWTVRIVGFAKEFVKKGHQVKIAYFPLEPKNDKPFYKDGIEHIPYSRDESLRPLSRNCSDLFKLAKWSDIIHFQKCVYYAALPSLYGSWRSDKPAHYDWDDWEEMIYYGSAASTSRAAGCFLRILERTIPTIVNTVSVASRRLHDICRDLGVSEDRIFFAPVGVDLEKFNPRISGERIKKLYNITRPLVFYIGQLNGAQYADMFIKAAGRLVNEGIDADFMIVGDGYRAAELRGLAKGLGLDGKIIFTGAVEYNEVPEYIAASDIAVACFEDNQITRCKSPLKIAEYMACGKAIVASDVGEVRGMLGGSGILTKPSDAESLIKGIKILLEDEGLRKRMGTQTRRIAEETLAWDLRAEQLLRAYEMAIRLHEDIIHI